MNSASSGDATLGKKRDSNSSKNYQQQKITITKKKRRKKSIIIVIIIISISISIITSVMRPIVVVGGKDGVVFGVHVKVAVAQCVWSDEASEPRRALQIHHVWYD